MPNMLRTLLRSLVPNHETTLVGLLVYLLTIGAVISLAAYNLGLVYYLP